VKDDLLERIAYEAALGALAQQEGALRDLRARCASLLTAASLVVSFLGARALEAGLGLISWLALAAFTASLVATLYVLLPRDRLVFALDGPELYVRLWEARDDNAEIHRTLAYWISAFRAANKSSLDRLRLAFRVSAWALVAQVGLWAAELSSIV
jgi:hypothetical protein